MEGTAVVGGIALRPDDDPLTSEHGHVGYGIRPSARGRGLASFALGEVLREAAASGIASVLLVCERDNLASARVAERHGGRLDEFHVDDRVCRYVIDTSGRHCGAGTSPDAPPQHCGGRGPDVSPAGQPGRAGRSNTTARPTTEPPPGVGSPVSP